MGVKPNSSELLRLSASIYLIIKEISHSLIVEADTGSGGCLFDRDEILYIEQVVCLGDSEASDFGIAAISKIQQFGPGCRQEPQDRFCWLDKLTPLLLLKQLPVGLARLR